MFRGFATGLILLFTVLFSFCTSHAQNYWVKNYTIADGLPSNSTKKIFKDSRGYLWICTDAGLAKFDGKKFEVYNTLDGMAGDNVWSVTEDKENNMWFGSYDGGVTKYDGKTFKKYTIKEGLVGENIRVVKYSPKFNFIFVGAENGFSIIQNEKITSFSAMSITGKKYMTVAGMLEGSDFIYIYSYGYELIKYFPLTKKIIPFGKKADISNGGGFVSAFACSNKDTIFGLERTGFTLLSDKKSSFINIGQIFDYTEDPQKNIWIAAWSVGMTEPGGLFKFDGKTVTSFNKTLGIDSKVVWSVYYDKQNDILWVATEDKGVFSCSSSIFTFFVPSDFNADILNVVDILYAKDMIWVLTPQQIYTIEKNKMIRPINMESFYRAYNKSKFKLFKLDLTAFKHIIVDAKGEVWLLANVGMFKLSDDLTPVYYPLDYGYGDCTAAFDHNNVLFHSGSGPLRSAVITYPGIVPEKEYSKNEPNNLNIIVRHNDELWMGGIFNGIFRFRDAKTWAYNLKQQWLPKCVNSIYLDKNDNIIFGGTNGMVYIAKTSSDSLQLLHTICKNDGLNGQAVNWIKTSNNDSILWIATNTGLNKVNLRKLLNENSKEIFFYNKDEGFSDLNPSSCTIDSNGDIWVGQKNGIIKINTDMDLSPCRQSEIILSSFEINNQPVSDLFPAHISNWSVFPSGDINLNYRQNNINFTVDILNFINPDKDVFRHRLDGFEKQWSKYEALRKISYTNLPSGKYTLLVESRNLNSGISSKPFFIRFSIGKPFWATWWFRILMFLILLTAVYGFVKFRIDKIKKQEQLKTEIAKTVAEYEMKALQAQMNPHFVFNAMNSIQNYILDNNTDKALSYLSDFAKLIRLTLEHASKKWITLSEKIEYLNKYLKLELMRFKNKFEINILTNGINTDNYLLPPMIIQPFVENAIKHGLTPADYKGKLTINFEANQENLLCIIEDNGIGIKKASEINKKNTNLHQPKSIDVSTKRLELINDSKNRNYKIEIIDLTNEVKNTSGTRVLIYLPINIA